MNEAWAKEIVHQLVCQGVDYFCVAPGSRSTPLALAAAVHPQVKTFVHFDERGLGFHALGYAKGSKRPAAVIVTSGTAVGNLFPAVMEASNDRIPMVLLTADRPPELRDCGANQTLDQVKIFGSYARWEVDLPCPDIALPRGFLRSTISQAVLRSQLAPQGPVQINCMLREPLLSSSAHSFAQMAVEQAVCLSIPQEATLKAWAELMSQAEGGVLVVGSLVSEASYQPLFECARSLGWPIFPDILSQARAPNQGLAYYDLILKSLSHFKPDTVLHLGDQYVSKTLLEWLAACAPLRYFSVSNHPLRYDPTHLSTHRLACDPLLFCERLLPHLSAPRSSWLAEWQELSDRIAANIDPLLEAEAITEPGIIQSFKKHLSQEWALFFANSMPIRDADLFLFPTQEIGPVFANRGVSGIDGNIATLAGIAEGCQKPLVALLGDQTFLHDLNSLAQVKKSALPLILIVVNNHGGGIFSFMPVAERKAYTEEYFANAHSISFEKGAELFEIPYYSPKTQMQWEALFSAVLEKKESCIIELITDRSQNLKLHRHLYSQIKGLLLCSPAQSPAL